MSVFIEGVGSSLFGKQPSLSASQLAWTAVYEALDDSGLHPADIDAAYVGTVFGEPGIASRVLASAGITGIPIVTIENACASGTSAFHEAQASVDSGRFRHPMVLGIETMTARFAGAIHPELTDPEGRSGMALPSLYAMAATRYLHEGWVTPEQLALVSVKNRGNARLNPRAQYSGSYTVEDVLESRMIADPLTLLQCCPISDGAAAVILGPSSDRPDAVRVRSSAHGAGRLWDHRSENVWGFDLVRDVSRVAYEQAGVGPADVNVLEVHDAFTIGEIVTTEALGLAARGEGGKLVESAHTALDGPQPVNPSGGLLSRGHPLGATGVAQIMEIVLQLRGSAGDRQVGDARIGLVETMGGGASGLDGNAAVVTILERASQA